MNRYKTAISRDSYVMFTRLVTYDSKRVGSNGQRDYTPKTLFYILLILSRFFFYTILNSPSYFQPISTYRTSQYLISLNAMRI